MTQSICHKRMSLSFARKDLMYARVSHGGLTECHIPFATPRPYKSEGGKRDYLQPKDTPDTYCESDTLRWYHFSHRSSRTTWVSFEVCPWPSNKGEELAYHLAWPSKGKGHPWNPLTKRRYFARSKATPPTW